MQREFSLVAEATAGGVHRTDVLPRAGLRRADGLPESGVTGVLVALLAAGIVLDVVLYLRGRWTLVLAAVNTVLDVAFAGVVIWAVASQRLFDPAFATALSASPTVDPGQAADLVSAMGTGIAWTVGLVCAADAAAGWAKAIRARR